MKETIGKAVSLAFGLAVMGKEQVEKAVDELVNKGEITKEESKAWVEAVMERGQVAAEETGRTGREHMTRLLKQQGLAMQEEVDLLKKRIDALEQLHQNKS